VKTLLAWAARVVRRPQHVKPTFYRSRHRHAWSEATRARQAAYDRLVHTLDDLLTLQAG
jgi:hypothetical protein